MPSTLEPIKGTPLKDKPAGISKCGMSHATFAQHRSSSQWYELSANGQTIGSPIDLDFYRQVQGQEPIASFQSKQKERAKV
ncbi:MAG: hypothetical protein HC851_21555 [Acaryochloris sp. RU_4_1]|nr:hypothetical protein [Acaryochloris sp. RU_4_1]NJR56744.1 hypothetical protein [Acaryochloris sp. CRU_2_0]